MMTQLYLIASGGVTLYCGDKRLMRLETGAVVALWTLFAAEAARIRAVATPETVALAVERRELMRLLDIHQEVARGALRSMVRHYRRLREVDPDARRSGGALKVAENR